MVFLWDFIYWLFCFVTLQRDKDVKTCVRFGKHEKTIRNLASLPFLLWFEVL